MEDSNARAAPAKGAGSPLVRMLVVYPLIAVAAYLFATTLARSVRRGGLPAGEPAPPISAAGWLNGEPPPPEQLAESVVVVDAWFAGCVHCRRQAPELVELYEKYKGRGVVFIGLTPDDEQMLEESRAYLDHYGITWPNGYGAQETLDRWKVTGYPSTFVVARNNRIVWNADSPGTLDEAIERALSN
jgi:thiol-disulfide isomerase/thioredoxin